MSKSLYKRREVLSWAMYDWANSAYNTTVISAFFPVFFGSYWNSGVEETVSTARLGFSNSFAFIVIALLAPVLGSIADRSMSKKRFLGFFCALGVIMTFGLFFINQGEWQMAAFCYILATIGFSGSIVFYDSLLTSVAANESEYNKISTYGYSVGYLGGGLLLAVNVAMTLQPAWFGLADAAQAVKYSFVMVAVWWGLFTLPLMLNVKEPPEENPQTGLQAVKAGLNQLRQTFAEIRGQRNIFLFLLAYWLYIDGIDTIITMAVKYGQSIGFETTDLITALLMVQFVGFPAAFAFGFLAQKIGSRKAIYLAIFIYLCLSMFGAFISEVWHFYVLAFVIGLVQGGIQAISRAYFAGLIPKEKSGEYFGFYNMIGKFAAVIGPTLMGFAGLTFLKMGYPDDTASRMSITVISILFLLGAYFFSKVKDPQASAQTQEEGH